MAIQKLSLLALATLATKQVLAQAPLSAPYSGFEYLGCRLDNDGFRALAAIGPTPDQAGMTIEKCIDQCSANYKYIGLQYFYEVQYLTGSAYETMLIPSSAGAVTPWILEQ